MLGRVKHISLVLVSAMLIGCGGGGSSSAPTASTVTTPVASSKSVVVVEDSPAAITLESNAGANATYTIATPPSHGVLVGTPPYVVYVPNGDFNGTDSFSFTVTDASGTSAPATINIEVNDTAEPAGNVAPVAVDYNLTVDEDHNVSAPMAAVDQNGGDTLTFTVTAAPQHGSYDAINKIYTPNANYNGSDSFTYTANDGAVNSAPATVTISVTAVNDAPVADNKSVTVNEDGSANVTLSGSDVDGDPLTYSYTQPAHGTFDGTTYTPNANYNGSDSFTYTANDGAVNSAPATVTITVTAVNDAPVADDKSVTVNEDGSANVTLSGSDVDGDTLTYSYTQPAHGTFDGTTYTPNANYHGTDSFTYTVNDGTVNSAPATVTITVTAVNDAPVADNKSVTVNEDGSVNITLSGSDVDGDTLTYSYTQPAHGTFDGTTYTPNANYNGSDSFTYTVNDGTVNSAPATVTITVTAVNDAPVADDKSVTVQKNSTVNISLSGSDVDGDTLTYSIVASPSSGTINGTLPNITYTPNQDYVGGDSFTYKVNDGTVDSNTATVSISVLPTTVTVSGRITYDYVQGVSTGNGNEYKLDYSNIMPKPVRSAEVQMVDGSGTVLATTNTDENGTYSFAGIAPNTQVKIRVLAKMYKTGTAPEWDVKVVDNTNSDALYVMEGTLASVGTTDSSRNLNAQSGWGGSSYTGPRVAAPFAILDDIYATTQTILSADPQAVFPPLQVNWSVNNIAASGDKTQGQIGTSHYTNGNLFILGDADSDTDEYDNHVITHEWGHYYEDKFSRSDSIGGSHSDGDLLDIRVAFGEGWGNAFSAISLQDPVYFDTAGSGQATGWSMNVEDQAPDNPGWFSEASIQRIIYDLWDSTNESDNNDSVTLGFGPIHQVFTGAEKTTPAFTSLFTFIKALKDENPSESAAIDSVVAHESITTIDDIYGGLTGTARTNHASDYPYAQVNVGGAAVQIHTSNTYGSYNKLGNSAYIKVSIPATANYTINANQTNGNNAHPFVVIYKMSPKTYKGAYYTPVSLQLEAGEYLLDIGDDNNVANAQFDVTVQ